MAPKRSAAATAAARGTPRKRARDEGRASKIEAVVEALQDESLPTDVPMAVRQMLAKGAPGALGTVAEERHPMQGVVLGHIQEVLAGISEQLEAKVAECKQAVDRKAADLESLAVQMELATSELGQAEKEVLAKKEKFTESEVPVRSADADVKAIRSKQKINAKEHNALSVRKAKFTTIEDGALKTLVDGEWSTPKEANKLTDKLVKDMTKLGFDSSLLASVPAVLTKKPDERKGFDDKVLGSLKDVLGEKIASIDAEIVANEATAAELGKEAAEKDEVAQLATAQRDAASQDLEKAEAAFSERTSARAALEAAIAGGPREREALAKGTEAAQKEATKFDEVLAALGFLARPSPVPPPEEPAAKAAEAAAEAAAGAAAEPQPEA